MAEKSKIDYLLAQSDTEEPGGTWSPWLGCTHADRSCAHCWAETWASRFPRFRGHWGASAPRYFFPDSHWRQPLRWNAKCQRTRRRKRVLVSLCDPFERLPSTHPQCRGQASAFMRFWKLVKDTPFLDWLVPTKRPQDLDASPYLDVHGSLLPNLWLGVSVCDQDTADERIPLLLQARAAVRWVSLEPFLGPVNLDKSMGRCVPSGYHEICRGLSDGYPWLNHLDWIVIGCESGPGARPMRPAWAWDVVQQCAAAGVPCFTKQLPTEEGGAGRIVKSAELADDGWPVQLPEVRR